MVYINENNLKKILSEYVTEDEINTIVAELKVRNERRVLTIEEIREHKRISSRKSYLNHKAKKIAIINKIDEESRAQAEYAWGRWTEGEDKYILEHYKKDMTEIEMAYKLGRSRDAIRRRLYRLKREMLEKEGE